MIPKGTLRWYRRILAGISLSALTLLSSSSAATASNQLGPHWKRGQSQPTIFLTLRNQIGPGAETAHINLTLARWGSVSASNFYPSGAARTDFSLGYAYGGPPSCNTSGGYGNITFCVIAQPSGYAGALYYTASGGHFVRSYIQIDPAFRFDQRIYCQEFGHALGLAHRNGSCMSNNQANFTTMPGQHDLDYSNTVNSHTHSGGPF